MKSGVKKVSTFKTGCRTINMGFVGKLQQGYHQHHMVEERNVDKLQAAATLSARQPPLRPLRLQVRPPDELQKEVVVADDSNLQKEEEAVDDKLQKEQEAVGDKLQKEEEAVNDEL